MTDASEWTGKVGDTWAEEWARTDRSFAALTDRLLDPTAIGTFSNLVDIGCGAGELVARLAPRHPDARLTGLDISGQLLDVARKRCEALPNARFIEADAALWQAHPAERPDLLISRHGVMFFADPTAAFAQIRKQAAPGVRLRFTCFRARGANEWVTALASALPHAADAGEPHAPGPFAFADEVRVGALLADAGWRDVAFEPVDYPMIASGSGHDRATAVAEALSYFRRIGPAARALAVLPRDDRHAAERRIGEVLSRYFEDGRIAMPAAAWLVTARAR